MNVITSSIGIQKTRYDKGVAAEQGLPESDFRTDRANLDEAGNARVREIISQALAKAIDAIAGACQAEDKELLKAAMKRNIDGFELCSGSGFTGELEARLKKDQKYAKVWIEKSAQVAAGQTVTAAKF